MAKNYIQFFLILSARTFDAIVLFIIYPKLFNHFGLEFVKISQFMSIASVVAITVKLGFDSVIILNTKNEKLNSDFYIQSIFWAKIILSLPAIFFAALYNFYIQSTIGTWILVWLIIVVCLSEIFNFSQLTLIYKNALWVFSLNLAKVCILLIGVEIILVYSSLGSFLWLHVVLLFSITVSHFLLNRVYNLNFWQTNIYNVLSCLSSSLNFFMLRIFSLLSDKLVLMFSISTVSQFDFIILELFVKFVALFAVPTFIFFNFVRSRSLFINHYILGGALFLLSVLAGFLFFFYVYFFDYIDAADFSAEDLFYVSVFLTVTVLFSQIMIYVSDFSAIRPDRKKGSKFVNLVSFFLPLSAFVLVDQSSLYFSIFVLNSLYLVGVISYTAQNFFGSIRNS